MVDPGVILLHQSSFGVLTHEPALGRLTLVRSAEPLDPTTFEPVVDALVAAIDGIDAQACGLLFDVRAVVGRNDDAFEAASLSARRRFIARFGRTAVLVRTLVGRLQGERLAREDQSDARVLVTTDLDDAIAFLRAWAASRG